MDKEIRMTTRSSQGAAAKAGTGAVTVLVAISALLTVTLTAGCGNPFRREANPYRDYSYLTDNARPYSARQMADDRRALADKFNRPCGNPFTVSVQDKPGKYADFIEGQPKTAIIVVKSTLEEGRTWDVRAIETPCAECFKPMQKSQSEGIYEFTWTPPTGSADTPDANNLVLRFDWKVESHCAAVPVTEPIHLSVAKENGLTVSFPGLTDKPVANGKGINFSVKVVDTTATRSQAPALKIVAPSRSSSSPSSGEQDASGAINCTGQGRALGVSPEDAQAWVFDCTFDSQRFFDKTASDQFLNATFIAKIYKGSKKSPAASAVGRIPVRLEKAGETK